MVAVPVVVTPVVFCDSMTVDVVNDDCDAGVLTRYL